VDPQTVAIEDADALLDRMDLIVCYDDGNCVALAGEPDAAPVPPSPDTGSVGLAQVWVPRLGTTIEDGNISDKRTFVNNPIEASNWTMLGCATDVTRTNTAALTNDPDMAFTMSANGKYRIRGHIIMLPGNAALKNINTAFTGPGVVTAASGGVGIGYPSVGGSVTRIRPTTWPYILPSLGSSSSFPTPTLSFGLATIDFDLIYHNGASTGTFAFQWCQSAASATWTVTRYAGSYMEYEVV
jgi:hypothetical protein